MELGPGPRSVATRVCTCGWLGCEVGFRWTQPAWCPDFLCDVNILEVKAEQNSGACPGLGLKGRKVQWVREFLCVRRVK